MTKVTQIQINIAEQRKTRGSSGAERKIFPKQITIQREKRERRGSSRLAGGCKNM